MDKKKCFDCNTVKPWSEFYLIRRTQKPIAYCKPCSVKRGVEYARGNRATRRAWEKRRKKTNPQYTKQAMIKFKYGLTPEAYDKILADQDHSCAICKKKNPTYIKDGVSYCGFTVDHCHKTDVVRGILCRKCNSALGQFGDSLQVVEAAARYLLRCNQPSDRTVPYDGCPAKN